MNLNGRVTLLEQAAVDQARTRQYVGEVFMQKIFEQADRIRLRLTPPPIAKQSPVEQCIRGALAEAEGIEDRSEYARVFWQGFVTRTRAFIREHDR